MDYGNPTSHSYFSQRLRLHYLDWGNPGAPHLLLLHGIQDQCHSWDWVARRLRARFHVMAPDLRGHGDSQWTRGSSYAWLEYVQDVAQLVRQAELEPVTLVGHSMGGTIAALYAGIFPEAVTKLVIVEGVGLHPDRAPVPAHERLRNWISSNYALAGRTPRRYPSLDAADRRMQETNPHLSPEQARHLTVHGADQNEDGTFTWKFDNYTRTRYPYDVPRKDTVRLWERIACPVLIVNSKEGYGHRIGQHDTLRHFQDVRLVEIGDAGHWTHHDQLEEFLETVEPFL